ncbi:hypothetical protein ACFQAT_07940 [Undibacterium arcticum]|uniref:TolA protein n=1 Tax=Undibacterium arcticum TaxID=1762892 RepID=A0ABV7EXD3_9BURK
MENNIITIEVPPKDLTVFKKSNSFLAVANAFVVDSIEMHGAAADDLKGVKTLQKRIEDQRTEQVGPLNKEVKRINDEYREPAQWLADAEAVLKSKMLTFQQDEQRKAAALQRIADETARKERQRIEAEARAAQEEIDRQAREVAAQQAKAEQERRDAEAAKAQAEADAKAAAEAGDKAAAEKAQAAIDAANKSEADAVAAKQAAEQAQVDAEASAAQSYENIAALELSAVVMTAPAVQTMSKVSGISTSKTWKARITDKAALLAFIATHPECLDWVDVKMTPLNGMAKALKNNMNIPGVEAYAEETMSARAA